MKTIKKARIQAELSIMDHEELVETMGLIRQSMKLKSAGINAQDYFVCPITDEVLKKRSGKKIVTLDKTTRYSREQSWYFMSRKAFNAIKKSIPKDLEW